jgi:WD40 repeat protein/diadenosine tetraphosphatase ApaH/serine/threonine PP2A family protein phosphatase
VDVEGLGNNRSISIQESAIGSTLISGNGNQVTIYQYQTDCKDVTAQAESPASTSLGANPYKGLLAFQETDGDRYFGREVEINTLWEKLRSLYESESSLRLLPIYGPSGSGKSSLARAGLIPELARRPLPGKDKVQVAVLVPGVHPLESLAAVLARAVKRDVAPVAKTREFKTELQQPNEEGDYDGLRRIASVLPSITTSPLIVLVDQFEEVYSLCEKEEERNTFIANLLCAAAERSRQVLVIVTLRSDFLGQTQQYSQLNRLFSSQGFLVPAMNEDNLRVAIVKPAEQAGYTLDDATIRLLIEQTEGREGALPLLQFALTRIWEGLEAGITPAITLERIGGVGGALAGEAQRVYDELTQKQKDIARRLFLGVVQLGEGIRDTRRRAELNHLRAQQDNEADFRAVLNCFSAPGVRLITLAAIAEGMDTVEVTHEALFEHWQQLNIWLDESRDDIRFQRRLQDAAQYWDKQGCPNGLLWRPPDLDLLKSFHQRAGATMTPLELEFLKASVDDIARVERERQRQRRLLIRTLSAGLVISLSATGFSVYQLHRAELERMRQYELTAKQLAVTNPRESLVNGIAAVGLGRSILVRFPNLRISELVPDALLLEASNAISTQGFRGHQGEVTSTDFSPDGKSIVSGGEDGTVRLWTLEGQLVGQPFRGHEGGVSSVGFSPDGKRIVSGGGDETVRLWTPEGKPIGQPFRGHEGGVSSVGFSPDGKSIVSGSYEGPVRLWTLEGKSIGQPFQGHKGGISSVAFSPDGKRIVSGGYDRTVRLWTLEGQPVGQPFEREVVRAWTRDGKIISPPPIRGDYEGGFSVGFSPDGKRIVSARHGDIDLWTLEGQLVSQPFQGYQGDKSVRFSPDGKRIVSGGGDGTVRLWTLEGKSIGQPFRGHEGGVSSVGFSPDGKRIVSGGWNGTVRLWTLEGKSIGQPFRGDGGRVLSVGFSPDGKRIVSGGWDGTVRLWTLEGKSIGQPFRGHKKMVLSVGFSPDGKSIVSGGGDGTVRLWTLEGKPIGQPFRGQEGGVSSVGFSPDGKSIVSGGDGTVRLWTLEGKSIGQPFRGHEREVNSVGFSPDGKSIVSGGDGTVRLWTLEGKSIGQPFRGHEGKVNSVGFSPDGKRIVSGGDDGTVRLWSQWPWLGWLSIACKKVDFVDNDDVDKEAERTCERYASSLQAAR